MSDDKAGRVPTVEERQKYLAEARQADARAKLAEAQAKLLEAQTKDALAQSESSHFYAAEKRRKDEEIMASDWYNNVYTLSSVITESAVIQCTNVLSRWSRMKPKSDMTLIISSPGGELIAGMALYDFLLDLRNSGHKLTTISRGYAASLASVLMQAGTERVAGKESWMLIHKGSLAAEGNVDSVVDQVAWVKKIGERVLNIYSIRAAGAKQVRRKDVEKIKAFIRTSWERKDFWLSSEEAFKYGFVDRIEGRK